MSLPLQLVSMGKALPARTVTSAELEKHMHLEPGWILARSGVNVRHYAEVGDTNASLGAKALQRALDKAQLQFTDIDLLINASGSYDHPIPDTSCLIQRELGQGDSGVPCFSVDATCLSFISALDVASAFLATGRYKRIAIVSSEISSRSLNPNEWESATLLGDGAAAAIVQRTPVNQHSALLASRMETYGNGAMHIHIPAGGNVQHPRVEDVSPEAFTVTMNGLAVLTKALRRLRSFRRELFAGLDFQLGDIDLFVPHQASRVSLDKIKQLLDLQDQQFVDILADHGNCIAASIPMALHDAIEAGRLQRGQRFCLLGTGAGLSLGAMVLKY